MISHHETRRSARVDRSEGTEPRSTPERSQSANARSTPERSQSANLRSTPERSQSANLRSTPERTQSTDHRPSCVARRDEANRPSFIARRNEANRPDFVARRNEPNWSASHASQGLSTTSACMLFAVRTISAWDEPSVDYRTKPIRVSERSHPTTRRNEPNLGLPNEPIKPDETNPSSRERPGSRVTRPGELAA